MKILLAGLTTEVVASCAKVLESTGVIVERESDLRRALGIVAAGDVRVLALPLSAHEKDGRRTEHPDCWDLIAAAVSPESPARVVALAPGPMDPDLRRRAYGAGVWELLDVTAARASRNGIAPLLIDGIRRACSGMAGPPVLFVDSCSGVTAGIGSLIADDGFVVDTVSTTSEAIRMMTGQDYALIITEAPRTGPDGFGIMKAAASLQPGVPVVVLTASLSDATVMRTIELGGRDCLWKLAEPEEILSALRAALEPLEKSAYPTLREEP